MYTFRVSKELAIFIGALLNEKIAEVDDNNILTVDYDGIYTIGSEEVDKLISKLDKDLN